MSTPLPQFYGIKTADNLGLYTVVEGPIPAGKDPSEFWPVNAEVPAGKRRLPGIAGWQLVNGVVEPVLVDIPAPPPRRAKQREFWRALRQLHPTITRTAVRAIIPTLPGLVGNPGAIEDALVDFDTAFTVQIDNPLIPLVQAVYTLTDAQVVAVFDLAETLQ